MGTNQDFQKVEVNRAGTGRQAGRQRWQYHDRRKICRIIRDRLRRDKGGLTLVRTRPRTSMRLARSKGSPGPISEDGTVGCLRASRTQAPGLDEVAEGLELALEPWESEHAEGTQGGIKIPNASCRYDTDCSARTTCGRPVRKIRRVWRYIS